MLNHEQLHAQLSVEYGGPAIDAWPTSRGDKLRPHKGGDGGAGAAREQEAERQARVNSAVQTINGVFDGPSNASSRQALYNEQKKAVTDLNTLDVNKQFKEAERQNRFGLARSGLLGGQADIDSNAQLQERTNKGLIQASALGDGAAAELKTADERARQSLISMAQSGIDTGTAQTMALRQLDAASQNAQANRQGATIGSLFNDMSQAYLMNRQRAGQVAGMNATGQQAYSGLDPHTGYAGSVNN